MDKMTDINWKSLSEEDKKKLKGVYQDIDKISEFSCKANQKLFIYLFGQRMGEHYWEKFSTSPGRDVLHFMRGMDSDAKGNLMANIFLNESLYANLY